MTHECTHDDDWKEYQEFKEEIRAFIAGKNIQNGVTQVNIKELKEEIQSLERKLDRLLFIFITAFITLITTALITIIQ